MKKLAMRGIVALLRVPVNNVNWVNRLSLALDCVNGNIRKPKGSRATLQQQLKCFCAPSVTETMTCYEGYIFLSSPICSINDGDRSDCFPHMH